MGEGVYGIINKHKFYALSNFCLLNSLHQNPNSPVNKPEVFAMYQCVVQWFLTGVVIRYRRLVKIVIH